MTAIFGALATLLAVTTVTHGYSVFKDRIPNGGQVPHPCKPNYLWHGVGHINSQGGGERNAFGLDFRTHGSTWNQSICEMDSDGDGFTNGQELGDPGCVWTPGDLPSRTTSITHPGICDPWDSPLCQQINTWVNCDTGSFDCAALEDPEVRNYTIRFPPTPVPGTETNYVCMTFDLPSDQEYHLVATQPLIDNAQVMHHILVYACETENPPTISTPSKCGMEANSGCNSIIALWTVGHSGSCTQNMTGFLFGRGSFTRVRMEMHWNNPELSTDYVDSSGMILYYTPKLRPYSAATFTVGQSYLEIPPLQPAVSIEGTCSPFCTRKIMTQPVYVIEAMNHMHYLGKSQSIRLYRNGSLVATLTDEEAYSYDSPVVHIHDPPIEILPGDEIRTTCVYNSQYKDSTTYYGEDTSAEMCFGFLIVYPWEALPYTRNCVGYKSHTFCAGFEDRDPNACDYGTYFNMSRPETQLLMSKIYTHCKPFGPCTPECRQILEGERCLQEKNIATIKDYLLKSRDEIYFLSLVTSCKPEPECPKCPECPRRVSTTTTNNGLSGGETGGSPALLPGLISMAVLLILAVSL